MADIVVIDSDSEERNAIARTLICAGHRVHQAEDGAEGIAICRRENPALVITAMVMPEKDGIEIVRELPRDMPDVPIVATSGAPQASLYLRAARLLGAAAVLRKPFSGDELLTAIAPLLDDSADRQRHPAPPPLVRARKYRLAG